MLRHRCRFTAIWKRAKRWQQLQRNRQLTTDPTDVIHLYSVAECWPIGRIDSPHTESAPSKLDSIQPLSTLIPNHCLFIWEIGLRNRPFSSLAILSLNTQSNCNNNSIYRRNPLRLLTTILPKRLSPILPYNTPFIFSRRLWLSSRQDICHSDVRDDSFPSSPSRPITERKLPPDSKPTTRNESFFCCCCCCWCCFLLNRMRVIQINWH